MQNIVVGTEEAYLVTVTVNDRPIRLPFTCGDASVLMALAGVPAQHSFFQHRLAGHKLLRRDETLMFRDGDAFFSLPPQHSD